MSIPVYEDGENLWISMLPEKEAAHLMTSLVTNSTEERTMNERTKAALLRLLEDDEDLVAAIESRVDGVGRAVAEQQLVSREAAETEEATAEATEEAPIEEAVEEAPAEGDALLAQEVELDDEAITMLAQAAVQSPAFQALLDPLRVSIATLTESLAALAPRLEAAETRARTAEERLEALERDETAKQRDWLGDLPSGRQSITVTYRPKVARGAVEADGEADDEPKTMAEIAEKNLAGLPSY